MIRKTVANMWFYTQAVCHPSGNIWHMELEARKPGQQMLYCFFNLSLYCQELHRQQKHPRCFTISPTQIHSWLVSSKWTILVIKLLQCDEYQYVVTGHLDAAKPPELKWCGIVYYIPCPTLVDLYSSCQSPGWPRSGVSFVFLLDLGWFFLLQSV